MVFLYKNSGTSTAYRSDDGFRERPRGPRRRRGRQKLSGKRIGSGRHFGKCGLARTPKGQPAAFWLKGISQVRTEAEEPKGIFRLFLFAQKAFSLGRQSEAPSLRELSSIARLRESSPSLQNSPSVTALAGDAPCHLPQRGRHFGSLTEGAVEHRETEGVLPFSAKYSLRHGACGGRAVPPPS